MLSSTSISTSVSTKFANDFCPIPETRVFFGKVIDDLLQRSLNDIIQSSSTDKGICKKCRLELNKILKNLPKTDEESGVNAKAMRRALHGCFVLVCIELSKQSPWTWFETNDDLLNKYLSFSSCTPNELDALLTYRNYMAVSVALKKAEGNKEFHMHICAQLSHGHGAKYVTGSGQSDDTSRRVEIYEIEGGAKKKKRVRGGDDDSTSCDSSVSSVSKRSRSGSISSIESTASSPRYTRSELTFDRSVFSDPYHTAETEELVNLMNGFFCTSNQDIERSPTPAAVEVSELDKSSFDFSEEYSFGNDFELPDLTQLDESTFDFSGEDSIGNVSEFEDLII